MATTMTDENEVAAWIKRTLAEAPPLTAQAKARVARLLAGGTR